MYIVYGSSSSCSLKHNTARIYTIMLYTFDISSLYRDMVYGTQANTLHFFLFPSTQYSNVASISYFL